MVVAGAFDERALAFGDEVGQGEDGLGGEHQGGRHETQHTPVLASEKHLFSGVRMG